ncbi:hypothetical protein CK486_14490 [Pseudomonas sp. HAR-UPW-AIA-41]|uniref:hypothetical protein n=1 Tax=Pseudomonas sp. HAR-UPW-AIA-41 TaxID=1985301 RepID=UPI000BB3859A|nr:hypothetical protein [Pseudomonas sp. HAR-UPW-AIA-41]PAV47116.1 hypothetical protein CK486_14490 [Pseudomonas sp. HAR-UPW-AIA-41]
MDRALLRHLAHLSTIATALLAIGGLLVAVWQIRASEASQREASARDAYKEYLKLVIEKPELAEPDLPGSTSGPAREAGQDNLFSFYLFSAEQIFDAFPDDPGWHQSLQSDLCGFRQLLGPRLDNWHWSQHEAAFVEFAQQALINCTSARR